MATLDVLDFQLAVDEALAQPGPDGGPLLPPALRRSAVKEARRTIDAMAFRFALLDQRALPEDLDYLRALEAMKRPEAVARVLARRRPVYAANRRRRLTTTWAVLAVIGLVSAGFWYVVTSEEAVTLVDDLSGRSTEDMGTVSLNRTFTVTPEMTRLRIEGNVIVYKDSEGIIEVRLVAPDGSTAFYESYAARAGNFLRANVPATQPGEWTLLVDFLSVDGAASVSVNGVQPSR